MSALQLTLDVSQRWLFEKPKYRPSRETIRPADGFLMITELIVIAVAPPVGIPIAAATAVLFAWSRWRKTNNPQWQFQKKGQEAVGHVNAGNWEEALEALEECERIMPENPSTSGVKGQVLFQLRRCEEAIPLLQAGG